ncbi:hypothetical protein GmRootV15_66050 (plasmid) [Variovorax sp. V15]
MAGGGGLSRNLHFQRRLSRVFVSFAAVTSLLYGLLVYVVAQATEEFLLRRYVGAVLEWAMKDLAQQPAAGLPRASNLERLQVLTRESHGTARPTLAEDVARLYVRASPNLPAWARDHAPGIHRRLDVDADGSMVGVASLDGGQDALYVIVDGDGLLDIDQLEPYLLVALLLIGGAVTALGGFTGKVLARQLAQPLVTLTEEIDAHGEGPAVFSGIQRADEIGALSRGFTGLVDRLSGFLQREREFTRFASHELRTPVAVFKNNLSLLRVTSDPAVRERALSRMAQSAEEMEALVATFLALGREASEGTLQSRQLRLQADVERALAYLAPVIRQRRLTVALDGDGEATVSAPPELLTVLVDNLLRNAVAYAATHIRISLRHGALEIFNDVDRDVPSSTGYGLQIVARFCERQQWTYTREQGDAAHTMRIAFTHGD